MTATRGQELVVREHFRNASSSWGERYRRPPRRMSDLDLLLRRETAHRMLRSVLADQTQTLRVLDLGCGSGDVLDGLPRDAMRVVGIDLVPEMVSAAAARRPADQFLAADARRLPIADASLDVVTCLGVLEYLPDAAAALRAMAVALRRGGYLIVSFPNRASLCRRLSKAESVVERKLLSLARLRRPRRGGDLAAPKYQHTARSPREARDLLQSAGFSIVDWTFHSYGLWGKLGQFRLSLDVSRWLSRIFGRESFVSRTWACTMVMLARRTVS